MSNEFQIGRNVLNHNFGNIAYEFWEISKNDMKVREFLQTFIEKITVFYDKDKAEHTLVVHVKKTVLQKQQELRLSLKKKVA